LDSFRGYRNAIRDELPNAAAVPDAFHVVELDTVVVDEVRRRIQQDTLARRGHKDDPLYKIRGLLRRGHEQLTNRRPESLNPCLVAGDPTGQVSVAWHCYQQVRSMYQDEPASKAAPLLRRSSPPSSTVPSPEIAQLGRTLRTWKDHVLAPFDTHRISNGGTEAVNLIIEKVRRLAHGFRRKAPIPTRAPNHASIRRARQRCESRPASFQRTGLRSSARARGTPRHAQTASRKERDQPRIARS
jgi:transposase